MTHGRAVPLALTGLLLVALMTVSLVSPAAASGPSQFHGHVSLGTTASPAGLNDVLVTAYGGRGTYSGTTDASGNWQIAIPDQVDLYTISYHYQGVGAIAFADMWDGNMINGTPAYSRNYRAAGGGDSGVPDIVLPAPGTITGAVSLQGGTVGAGDVSIRFSRLSDAGVWSAETALGVTDSSGHYAIPDFAPGYYRVHFVWLSSSTVQSRYWSGGGAGGDIFGNEAGGLQVLGGATVNGLLFPKQNAAGHITLGSPGDRLRVTYSYDADEAQIESSKPRPSPQWTPVPDGTAMVDPATGAFSLPNLADAYSYRFTVDDLDAPALTETVYRYTYGVTLTGPSGPMDISIELARTAVLSGSASVQGTNETPPVNVGAVDSGGHIVAQTVEQNGSYAFPALPVGTYALIYRYDPLTDASIFDARQTVDLPGEATTAPDMLLPPQSALSTTSSFNGHVMSTDGTPLAGITVTAFEYGPDSGAFITSYTTTTDAQGAYTFATLPIDAYGFEAHDAAHTYATMEYDNESPYYQPDDFVSDPGWNHNIDFSMPRAAHITGTVLGPPSSDFAAGDVTANVEVEDYSNGSPVWFDTGDVWPVGADGTYDVGDLPPDDYRLQISDSGVPKYATETTRTIHVDEGQTVSGVDVTLLRTSSGGYVSLPPSRLLDTRSGLGVPNTGAVAPLGVVKLQVAGQGGVPSSGVSAVVLNVTVAGSTSSGFVTVWADSDPAGRPTTSSLNFLPGQIVPNLVIAPVGADGKVDLYNGSPGSTSLLADVAGYYVSGAPTATGTFGAVTPSRLLDTRSGLGAPAKPIAPLDTVVLQVGGKAGVPKDASAVVLNVTVAGSTSSGFITVWGGGTRPTASSLNFLPGQIVPNLVIVPLDSNGTVSLYNGSAGSTSLLADVAGYFMGGTADPLAPGALGAVTPSRLLDTRSGAPSKPVAPLGVVRLQVTGRGGVPSDPTKVSAVVLNVTVAGSTSSGFITVWADKDPAGRPTTSSLNFLPGQIVPNLVIAPVGADGYVDLYNGSPGSTSLVADVAGWYAKG